MTDISELQAKEMEDLNQDYELFDLESLITDGVNAKVPVEIQYNGKTFGAILKPLTNYEWNNALRKGSRNNKTTSEIELLKLGLFTKDDKEFSPDLVEKLPAGVITELSKELARISGIHIDSEQNIRIVKEMMGF